MSDEALNSGDGSYRPKLPQEANMRQDHRKFLHEACELLTLAESEPTRATCLHLIKSAKGCVERALDEDQPERPIRDPDSAYGDRREIPKARNW